jgi:glycosyltransferase involved in cell wall biosynthesis
MEPVGEQVAVITAVDMMLRYFLMPQICAMRDAGFQVMGICSPGAGVQELRDKGLEVETVTIPRSIKPFADLVALIHLWRVFRKKKVKVVHTHTPKAAFLGQLAALLAGVPVRLTTVHGLFYIAYPPGLRRSLFKFLELFACRLATHVFCVSEEDVPVMRQYMSADKIEWTGNGVNLTQFNPNRFSSDQRNQIRRDLKIPEDAFVLGIVARMVKEKGVRELLEALAQVRKDYPNSYVLLVGPIDRSRGDEATNELSELYGVAENSRWLGERSDVPEMLAAMDVFCLPSYREGYPVSVIEAGAMGLPSIVTNVRGCREAVIEGVNGLLVPAKEVQPLADAIRKLHDDSQLRAQLGQGARRRAEGVFDERKVVNQVVSVYRRLRPTVAPPSPLVLGKEDAA